MRGARTGSNPAPHLLAALDQAAGTALTQRRVADKSNEIPALPELLAPLDLDGAVVTADAMHTQTGTAQWIISRGAHYVLTVKNNQPGLKRALKKLPWKDVPSTSVPDGSHGRRVRRTVQAVEAPAWIDFPGAAQVIRIRRTRTVNKRGGGRRTTTEVAHLICSLPMTDAPPELVASWARGHWAIENRLHWIRDVVFDEDRHQLRTANGPFGLGRPAQPRHQPHQTPPRPPSPHRRHHQSHGKTPRTSHQTTHPTNPLTRLCRPPGIPTCAKGWAAAWAYFAANSMVCGAFTVAEGVPGIICNGVFFTLGMLPDFNKPCRK